MNSKIIKFISIISLLACIVLVFSYPHLMISPGALLEEHKDLTTDCFSCHAPFTGSSSQKCAVCHKIDDIGLITTKGVKIQGDSDVSFHQHLKRPDCVACHIDHQGTKVYRSIEEFSHDLLTLAVQDNCDSCHQTPADFLHEKFEGNCDQCHSQTEWKPATFDHQLTFVAKNDCDFCHQKPSDSLHKKLVGNCDQCHTQTEWQPSTFDHNKYFRFDRHHNDECVKCHLNQDYKQYSCYECHEHSVSKIRSEHEEEGIFDYDNCTECHRSGDEDEAERLWKSKRRELRNNGSRSEKNLDDDNDSDSDRKKYRRRHDDD